MYHDVVSGISSAFAGASRCATRRFANSRVASSPVLRYPKRRCRARRGVRLGAPP